MADATSLDSLGWEVLKKALNQRVVAGKPRFVPSKVNRVWIIETDVRPVVMKRFLSGRCDNEFEALLQAKLSGLDVPYPLAKQGDYLVSEFIQGENCEILLHKMFSSDAAVQMGVWLAEFHKRMSTSGETKIMGDASPSNFVMSNGRVFGFDLEDVRPGDQLDDVGKLAAAILGNEPFFTPIKFDICLKMLKGYGESMGTDVMDSSRVYISRHLRLDATRKPLFRRTLVKAAKALEKGWPKLA